MTLDGDMARGPCSMVGAETYMTVGKAYIHSAFVISSGQEGFGQGGKWMRFVAAISLASPTVQCKIDRVWLAGCVQIWIRRILSWSGCIRSGRMHSVVVANCVLDKSARSTGPAVDHARKDWGDLGAMWWDANAGSVWLG